MPEEGESWNRCGKFVLKELERLGDSDIDHGKVISINSVDIGMLKIKAGAWGLLGGLIPALALLIYFLIKIAPLLSKLSEITPPK